MKAGINSILDDSYTFSHSLTHLYTMHSLTHSLTFVFASHFIALVSDKLELVESSAVAGVLAQVLHQSTHVDVAFQLVTFLFQQVDLTCDITTSLKTSTTSSIQYTVHSI